MSGLQRQLLPIQIGGGVDTKTDDKKVISTKLLTLENGVFTNPGELEKRNGYQAITLVISGGGLITNPKAIKAYNYELVCAAENSLTPGDGRLFSYSPDLVAWVDKGKYVPTKITQSVVSGDFPELNGDGTSDGNYIVSAWVSNPDGSGNTLYYVVRDIKTGTFLIPETSIATGLEVAASGSTGAAWAVAPCVINMAANTFGIFYLKQFAGPVDKIVVRIVTITGMTVSIGAEMIIATNAGPGMPVFSTVATPTGAALFAFIGGSLKLFTIDPTGTVTNSTIVAGANSQQVYIQNNSFDNSLWVYWNHNSTGILHYAVYTAALTVILANTSTLLTGFRVVTSSNSASMQTMYYYDDTGGTFPKIKRATVTSAGVIGAFTQIGSEGSLFSDPIVINGRVYLPLFYQRTAQSLYALIDVQNGEVIATFLSGTGVILNSGEVGATTRPFSLGASIFGLDILYQYAPAFSGIFPAPLATTIISIDFDNQDAYQAIEIKNSLIWNGGGITEYDGQPTTELGFFLFPQVVSGVQGAAGNMADGAYEYQVVYEWYDNVGQFHQSAPSLPFLITIAGGGGTANVTLTILPLTITAKQAYNNRFPVHISIYRTTANGTILHLINDPGNVILNTPFSEVVFTDGFSDAAIEANQTIYTTGGVVDNIYPPAAMQMTIYNNRLWIVDSENPNVVWYSKTVGPGIGLSFSDLLTLNVDERQGEITALGAFDDKIVYFKKTVPFFSVGDGANDLGFNSTLSLPQIVASDVGCVGSKSIILNMPIGIMFKSQKGIYLIDRSLQVQYIGREVEAFNNEVIISANLIRSKSQIRFLTTAGVALVYDYIYSQWSVFTNHTGLGADIWQDNYTYCRTDGAIFNETPGVYVDDTLPIIMKIGTAWIKMSEVQNYQRCTKLFVIGNYKSPHILHGDVYFDYEANPLTSFQFDPQGVLVVGGEDAVYQFRYFMKHQRCESFRIVLYDDFTNFAPGEGYSLTQISIEALLKPYGVRLSQYKSVG